MPPTRSGGHFSQHRTVILALLGLSLLGCVGGPQLTSLNGNVNGLIPSTIRPQKPDDTIPGASISLPPTTLADGTIAVRAVAYVNNAPIFENEWREAVNQHASELANLPESQRAEKAKLIETAELERLIDRELVIEHATAFLKKAKSKGMDELQKEAGKEFDRRMRDIKSQFKLENEDQVKSMFASQGLTVDSFRRQIERSFIAREFLKNLILPKVQTIPLAEIRDYYDSHAAEFQQKDRVKWQAMFVEAAKFSTRDAARAYAEQIAGSLRSGADFSATAKQLRDRGINILLSDAGVGETRGEVQPPEIEAALFRLKEKEISAPVELPGGYYIVRVLDRSYAGLKPFNMATQTDIRGKLMNLIFEREARQAVDAMKQMAVIQKIVLQ